MRNSPASLAPARQNPADHAGPAGSFPITNQESVKSAELLKGHAENPAAVGAKIASIVKRKGLSVPSSGGGGFSTDRFK